MFLVVDFGLPNLAQATRGGGSGAELRSDQNLDSEPYFGGDENPET